MPVISLQRAATLVVVLLAWLVPSQSYAYCRTTTCDTGNTDYPCVRDEQGCATRGAPLFWKERCISYGVQADGSPSLQLGFEKAQAVVEDAFEAWLNADCGGGAGPSFAFEDRSPILCHQAEHNPTGPNANVVMFHDVWPYGPAGETLALTTVTFNPNTGEILDADIEVASGDPGITVGDRHFGQDLQSIITHEIGHLLGMAHSPVSDATMYDTYFPGETDKRVLHEDDVEGICFVYPPGRDAPLCSFEPRNGFSSDCGGDVVGGCAVRPGVPASPGPLLLAAVLAWGATLRRRRRAGP